MGTPTEEKKKSYQWSRMEMKHLPDLQKWNRLKDIIKQNKIYIMPKT